MTEYLLLGVIPAILILLAGILISRTGEPEAGERRFLLFLLAVAVLLLLAVFVAARLTPEQDNRPIFQVSSLLTPAILGVLALLVLKFKWVMEMGRRGQVVAALLALLLVALLVLQQGERFSSLSDGLFVIPILVLALTWALGRRYGGITVGLSLLALAALLVLNLFLAYPPAEESAPAGLSIFMGFSFIVLPGLAVALAAVLVTGLLNQVDGIRGSRSGAIVRGALPLLLLGTLAYTILWASIWDQTDDGLAGLFLYLLASLVGIAAGMVMAVTMHGWRRLAGILFAMAVPVLMVGAFNTGWQVSYQEMTEGRAGRIERALERYRQREGRYPAELGELVPRDLLWAGQPLIFAGEGWCYQGGADYYRLGAIYREHWSAPLSVRVYASAGETAGGWACEERLAALNEKYAPSSFQEMQAQAAEQVAAQRTPLPASEVAVEKKALMPLTLDSAVMPGSWSPDGNSYFYMQPGEPGNFTFYFLDPDTAEVCQTSISFDAEDPNLWALRERHAWLADGRLFVVTAHQAAVVEPCGEIVTLVGQYPEPLQEILAADPEGRRILVEGETAFWLVDGATLEAQQISGITPGPDGSRSIRAAWSPDSRWLAIPDQAAVGNATESTINLVDPERGTVVRSLSIPSGSAASIRWMEWLSVNHLLAHGTDDLLVFDLTTEPPTMTRMLEEVFGLDINIPDEISSWSSVVNEDGQAFHMAIQVNHPRNNRLYLYHSETDSVNLYDHEVDALLFFEDGGWERASKALEERAFRDEFILLWPDEPEREVRRLEVVGHSPREYPDVGVNFLPDPPRLLLSSSQGISLVSLPDGDLLGYWEFSGSGPRIHPYPVLSPDGSAAVVVVDLVGVFFIQLAGQ